MKFGMRLKAAQTNSSLQLNSLQKQLQQTHKREPHGVAKAAS